jgi:hypothetical protein
MCDPRVKYHLRGPGKATGCCLHTQVPLLLEPGTLSKVPPFLPSLLGHHASARGGDVEGIRCRLHRPTNYSGYVRVQSLLKGTVSSCRTVLAGVALDHLSGGCEVVTPSF